MDINQQIYIAYVGIVIFFTEALITSDKVFLVHSVAGSLKDVILLL